MLIAVWCEALCLRWSVCGCLLVHSLRCHSRTVLPCFASRLAAPEKAQILLNPEVRVSVCLSVCLRVCAWS
jgi:hypothetical protein